MGENLDILRFATQGIPGENQACTFQSRHRGQMQLHECYGARMSCRALVSSVVNGGRHELQPHTAGC